MTDRNHNRNTVEVFYIVVRVIVKHSKLYQIYWNLNKEGVIRIYTIHINKKQMYSRGVSHRD